MARPRSDEKRSAILDAAVKIFAGRGLGAATSAISREAGVAEGTLFTYFRTKDELINVLYREIKLELADAMMAGFPRRRSVRTRLQHVWDRYTLWGVEHPLEAKLMRQLMVSESLTPETRREGAAPFVEIEAMAREAVEQRVVEGLPFAFLAAMMEAAAQTTMEFMAANPEEADRFREAGFRMFWKSIGRGQG